MIWCATGLTPSDVCHGPSETRSKLHEPSPEPTRLLRRGVELPSATPPSGSFPAPTAQNRPVQPCQKLHQEVHQNDERLTRRRAHPVEELQGEGSLSVRALRASRRRVSRQLALNLRVCHSPQELDAITDSLSLGISLERVLHTLISAREN